MSRHTTNPCHPALARLLRDQARASLRRLSRRLSSRRRLLLSCLAVVLSLIWLGNAALSVLFRESASPDRLRQWIPLGLLAYALWHVVKVGYRRPDQGIEWSAAQREILSAAPFSRGQLLTYRMASVVGASTMKAGCFVLLMLPDLPRPMFGFVGILLALLLIELWRMAVEITACGVSRTTYRRLRLADLACAATACVSALVIAGCTPAAPSDVGRPWPLLVLVRLGQAALRLAETSVGQLLIAPFHAFAAVILAEDLSGLLVLYAVVAVTLVVAMAAIVSTVDRYFACCRVERERHAYDRRPDAVAPVAEGQAPRRRLPTLPRQAGWLALAWRQSLGARHYWGSVLIAMGGANPSGVDAAAGRYQPYRHAVECHRFGRVLFAAPLAGGVALRFSPRRRPHGVAQVVAHHSAGHQWPGSYLCQ